MACDGVCSDPATGAVVGYVSKMELMPDLDCVMGITGVGGFGYVMRWKMPLDVVDFDSLTDCLPDLVLRTHLDMQVNGMVKFDDPRSCVAVAGWSERDQAYRAYRVVTYPKKSTNHVTAEPMTLEPWTLIPMTQQGMWASTGPDEEVLRKFGLTEAQPGDGGEGPLVRMVCASRAASGRLESEEIPGQFNAGGFCQVALLKRGHVQSWIAHRWPEDVIGEPIDPSRGQPLPDYLMPTEEP